MYYFNWAPFPQTIGMDMRRRVFLDNWAYLNGFHLYMLTRNCLPSLFQKALLKANRIFYSYNRILKCFLSGQIKLATDLFFRRLLFNKVENAIKKRGYLSYLQKLENGLYPKNKLDEEMLMTTKLQRLEAFNCLVKGSDQSGYDKVSINKKPVNKRIVKTCYTKTTKEEIM